MTRIAPPGSQDAAASRFEVASPAHRLAWLPVPLFVAAFLVLAWVRPDTPFEPRLLLPVLNLVFLTGTCLLVAVLAGRNFIADGSPAVLMLGSGALAFGLASAVSGAGVLFGGRADLQVTVYNLGALLAGMCYLASGVLTAFPEVPPCSPERRRPALLLAFAAVGSFVAVVTLARLDELLPDFFVPRYGPTEVRQIVLALASACFLLAAVLFRLVRRRSPSPFLHWYSLSLVLVAVGLIGVFHIQAIGSPLVWAARAAQYLGCLYMFVAVLSVRSGAQAWQLPLGQLLRETQARHQTLVDLCPDAILVHVGGRYVFANAAAARLFRAPSPADLIGSSVLDLVHPGSRSRVRARIERALAGEVTELQELQLLRFDGTAVDVEATGAAVQFEGRPAALVVVRDISLRKRSEEQLRERAEELEKLMHVAPVALWVSHDSLCRTIVGNRRANEFYEADQGENVSATAPAGEPVQDRRFFRDGRQLMPEELPMQVAAAQGVDVIDSELEVRLPSGRCLTMLGYASPLRDGEGDVRGCIAAFLDITARRQMEQQLRDQADRLTHANRLKDEFLATLSHELRTPLNAIVGWAHLLQRHMLDAAAADRAVRTIIRNAEAQTQLVENMLDVSRIVTGKLQLRVRPMDLAALLGEVIDAVKPAADAKEIAIESVVNMPACVSGDPDRMQQVLWNLLSNAVKFTPQGGRVVVALEKTGSHVEVTVRDTGIGIDAGFLPHVFAPFRQADGATTRLHGGLGLGLSIVRHLVELHGGSVAARSDGLGQGSTFTVSLPVPAAVDVEHAGTPAS